VRARAERRRIDAARFAQALATVDDAYAVQAVVERALGWFEGLPQHWKSGGATLAAMSHAPLPPAGVWAHPARAGDWPFHLRIIEAEIALRMGVDVDAARAATVAPQDAAALVDAMAVAIEIVDSRWSEGTGAPSLLRLADLQSHGALVLGEWMRFDPRDWANQACRASIDGAVVAQRRGGHPLGDPAAVLPAWLRHASRDAAMVPAGTVVTTGAWIVVPDTAAGSRVEVAFDGIGQAEVQL
jgi:2-keto-4-pentenoate hydratase